ncbi:MAG: hypothetical protein V1681_01550 [Candidatus Neomarinimicrobiota bacterium]
MGIHMLHTPKEKKPIEFRLKDVELIECSFRKPKEEIKESHNFGFSFGFGAKFDEVSGVIIIQNDINVFHSPDQKIEIGKVTSETIFYIANFNDFISAKKKIAFPHDFIIMLMSISYSTLRGIIIERSAGTLPEPVILPIINLNEIIKPDKKKNTPK